MAKDDGDCVVTADDVTSDECAYVDKFAWKIWSYVRLNRNSLDSEMHCDAIKAIILRAIEHKKALAAARQVVDATNVVAKNVMAEILNHRKSQKSIEKLCAAMRQIIAKSPRRRCNPHEVRGGDADSAEGES
jgi:hypothetical protein